MRSSADTRALVFAALLTALGIALHIVESMIPFTAPFPGAKIGLANITVLLCLYILPLPYTVGVFFLRIILSSLLVGTFLSAGFFIGGTGGMLSLLVMLAVKKIPRTSLLGVSMAGAAAHNLGQVLMATFIINNTALLYYLPVALLLALPAGFLTGLVARAALALLNMDSQVKKNGR